MDSTPLMTWFERVRRTGPSAGGGGSSSSKSGGEAEKVAGLRALLKKAKLEGKLGVAEAWCDEQGAESVSDIKEYEMEEAFIGALGLKEVPAKKLRKALEAVKVVEAAPSERHSVGDTPALSGKI